MDNNYLCSPVKREVSIYVGLGGMAQFALASITGSALHSDRRLVDHNK